MSLIDAIYRSWNGHRATYAVSGRSVVEYLREIGYKDDPSLRVRFEEEKTEPAIPERVTKIAGRKRSQATT